MEGRSRVQEGTGHFPPPARGSQASALCSGVQQAPTSLSRAVPPSPALRAPSLSLPAEQDQQLGLEQGLHLTLNLSLFLLNLSLFLVSCFWSKEGDMKNILGSSHTVLKFNFFLKTVIFVYWNSACCFKVCRNKMLYHRTNTNKTLHEE